MARSRRRARAAAGRPFRPHLVPTGLVLLTLLVTADARAAGVVGTGAPASCTEAALDAALVGGGNVTFNCGPNPVIIPVTAQKVIAAATTIDGGNADRIILDAGGVTRLFLSNTSVNLTVRNLTLRNGRCPLPTDGGLIPGYGGAIRAGFFSTLTISDSKLLDNKCAAAGNDVGGGAIFVPTGTLIVERSHFSGNQGGNGGAIGVNHTAVTVNDSVFTNNTTNAYVGGFSGVGGGVYVDEAGGGLIVIRRSTFTNNSGAFMAGAVHIFLQNADQGALIEDSTFRANTTVENGGAFFHQNKPLTITGCTFSGNSTVGLGAALYVVDSAPFNVTNSTFSGNIAVGIDPNNGTKGIGGALFLYQFQGAMSGTLNHVTIADNHADWVGGGIATSGAVGVSLRGSIVANNTSAAPGGIAANCATQMLDGGFNLQFPASLNPTSPFDPNCTAGITIADPLLAPLAANGGLTETRALTDTSPAINAVASGCPPPSVDQRGVSRPRLGLCDVGAYEAGSSLSINDVTVMEGAGGSANAVFTVTLSPASSGTVTVSYTTQDGTATAGQDYTTASGSVVFPAGSTSQPLPVPVLGDLLDEPDETFFVDLSSPVGATLDDSQGQATILDDDPTPLLSINDVSLPEGDSGSTNASFTVSLSSPSAQTVSAAYTTSDNTALAGSDYTATSGTVFFPPGSTAPQTLDVPVLGDTVDEPDERFWLVLSSPTNALFADSLAAGTILDDDGGTFSLLELQHGFTATTDLRVQPGPVADLDLYILETKPYSSYEVVVDEASGDLGTGNGPRLERVAPDLTTPLATSAATGAGPSRSLRMRNVDAIPADAYVAVSSLSCTTDCGTDDSYRVRAYETTYAVPRFNNSGSQLTVLLLQNPTDHSIAGTVYYWGTTGSLLGSSAFNLLPKRALVLNTTTVPGVSGQSGAITVAHDGRYGDLSGKTVALEPATGFSFDSPMEPRPR